MSLVYQALRKAEQERNRQTVTPVAPRPASPPAPPAAVTLAVPAAPPPAAVKTNSPLLAILLSVVALVAIVAIVVITLRAPAIRSESPAAPVAPTAPAVPVVAPPPAEPTPVRSTSHQLTGITKDPLSGKPLAIINGQLRGEQEYVDGAVITSIERDRVTLEVDGRAVVVRLF